MNHRMRTTSAGFVALLAVAAAACGSSSKQAATTTPATTPATTASSAATGGTAISTPTGATAGAGGKIAISMTSDSGCTPANVTAPAGNVTFAVTNAVTGSTLKQEFEIVSAAPKIIKEVFFTEGQEQDITVTLEAGTYQVICGAASNPRGTLVVTGAGGASTTTLKVDAAALQANVVAYTAYVKDQLTQMVAANNQLEAAIKGGNLDQAKALYEPARVQYERIEPIAELFPDSDAATDSRADDFPLKEQDPGFTGWHKVEYILFSQNTLDGAEPVMAQLQKDIQTLVTTINALTIDPATMINGSAGLIEEASKTKITGEEERYAHTDLATLQANVDGAKEIIDLNATLLKGANASLYDTIEASFTAINTGLAKYKNADGTYQTYDKLTDADRASLQAELATLSENLSMVAGAFGLEVK